MNAKPQTYRKEWTIELAGLEVDIEVEFTFDPGYPPPMASNPSSPAYSDPGSPPECEIQQIVRLASKTPIPIHLLRDAIVEDLETQILESWGPDAMDAGYEPEYEPEGV